MQHATCKGCEKRCVGCHVTCETYQGWLKEHEEERLRYRKSIADHPLITKGMFFTGVTPDGKRSKK
jgi:hypothetical protein